MGMRTGFVAAICLACWLIISVFPVYGYNSLNESADAALTLNIPALESDQVDEMPNNLTNTSSVVDLITNCPSRLWIVDYWGRRYSCDAKCVFLHDMARMIAAPCKSGLLKLHEEYKDGTVVESRYIPVSANKRYNWWFIGDIEGLHTLWFTINDRRGQVSKSNNVTYQVILENCPGIANCSPSSR